MCIWAAPRSDCPRDAPTPRSPRTPPPWPAAVPEAEQAGCPWCKTPPLCWSHCTEHTNTFPFHSHFTFHLTRRGKLSTCWKKDSCAKARGGCASWITNSAERSSLKTGKQKMWVRKRAHECSLEGSAGAAGEDGVVWRSPWSRDRGRMEEPGRLLCELQEGEAEGKASSRGLRGCVFFQVRKIASCLKLACAGYVCTRLRVCACVCVCVSMASKRESSWRMH